LQIEDHSCLNQNIIGVFLEKPVTGQVPTGTGNLSAPKSSIFKLKLCMAYKKVKMEPTPQQSKLFTATTIGTSINANSTANSVHSTY
jgi:hypothetical protein